MKSGIELIAAERQRQIEVEGWTASHDDNYHDDGGLLEAGIAYAIAGREGEDVDKVLKQGNVHWPWGKKWWKPVKGNQIRNLVKAGALIAAEIDRLQRS
jgi:hypothetical protein